MALTLDQIATDVASAKVYCIQQMAVNLVLLKNGQSAPNIKSITVLKRIIRCLTFQINAGVLDADTITLYTCLLNALAGFNATYNIDPSVIIPGQIINVIISGSKINTAAIQFTNQTVVSVLANYQGEYAATYGNSPLTVQIYTSDGEGGFNPDSQTAPDLIYVISGNPSSGLYSEIWTYPIATSGFVFISGIQPT